MPPGTGDVALTVFQSLPIDGIVIVSTPQDLVKMIVNKAYNMANMMNIPVLGLIENMSYYVCPNCNEKINIFGKSKIDETAAELGVPVLAKLPINPEINIREVTQKGKYYENGKWVTTGPLEIHKDLTYPNIGPRDSYLLYHEELESLVKNFPTIKRARFWMTFGQEYLTHLRVIQNIGMARIDEVEYNGMKIVPLQFLKAVLPNPQDLGENYEGETSIGCRIRGLKDGKERTYYVYNNCSHQEAYKETGMQGVSYTTGVPAMIGAMMFLKGLWKKPGVWNVEEFNPDPFMEQLNKQGLPWHEIIDGDLEV